ncbi:MAG: phosphate propanoyltransferase, partial [Clostridiales Family XIII bacterium]|nr:phosphate propanoyltransferase [Clostridiales Family XIII bacterium]
MNEAENIIRQFIKKESIKCFQNIKKSDSMKVPVGISNRHIHLSKKDLNTIFGPNYELTPIKDLSQPGQFACKETVTVAGPKGAIEKIRILGPVRNETQVEILAGDCFKLGIKKVVRLSADLDGSPGVTIIGTKGSVYLEKGAIVAKRHIHMTEKDAAILGYKDGQIVGIKVSGDRAGTYGETIIRVSNSSALDCHIDTE